MPEEHLPSQCRPETCGGVDYDPCALARTLTACPNCGLRQVPRRDGACRVRDCGGRVVTPDLALAWERGWNARARGEFYDTNPYRDRFAAVRNPPASQSEVRP